MSKESQMELDRHFAWFEAKLPAGPARFVGWLRKPSSRYVRIPIAILLILGGIFSILPVLGLWMLPLGLMLLAQDIAFLRRPVGRGILWMLDRWDGLVRRLKARRQRKSRRPTPGPRAMQASAVRPGRPRKGRRK